MQFEPQNALTHVRLLSPLFYTLNTMAQMRRQEPSLLSLTS